MKQTIRADELKHAISKRHTDDLFLTEVKTGATSAQGWTSNELLKFDALAIQKSWAKPCITGYEVKVARGDFLKDQKWPGYLPYCHKFSFVCPKGLIQPEELSEEVGLIWYYPDSGALVSKRPAKYRMIQIVPDLLYYILMSRIESDRHPFFSSRRDLCAAYAADKDVRWELSRKVESRLWRENRSLEEQLQVIKGERRAIEHEREQLQDIKEILAEFDIQPNRWGDWKKDLRDRLSTGVAPQAMHWAASIARDAQKLEKLLQTDPTP